MNDLIEILSSDDEKKKVPPNHYHQNNTIDLCQSSDDEQQKYPQADLMDTSMRTLRKKKKKKRSSASYQISSICLSIDDDEDDKDELRLRDPVYDVNQEISRMEPQVDKSAAIFGICSSNPGHTADYQTSHTRHSALQIKTKTPSKRVTPSLFALRSNFDDSDDGSDDDDLLNTPAWTCSKSVHTPIKSSLSTTPNAHQDSSNEKKQSSTLPVSSSSNVKTPYMKSCPVPQVSIWSAGTPFPYPKLMENSKQYPDERARFLLAFWKLGRSNVAHSFQRSKLDSIAKRMVKLALIEYPIRSIEEYVTSGNFIRPFRH